MDNSNRIKDTIIKNLGELATKNEDQIFQMKDQIFHLNRRMQEKEATILTLRENLSAIHNSWDWKLITVIRKFLIPIFPLHSRRRALADKVLSWLFNNKN